MATEDNAYESAEGNGQAPAPDDALLAAVEALGKPTAILLYDSGWMSRRKDSVEMLSDQWARRQTSVDIAIPLELEPVTPKTPFDNAHFAVPVTLLPKVPSTLMRFDFISGVEPLTLPTRRQNGLASYAALLWSAAKALDNAWPLPQDLRAELLFVAVGSPEYAEPVSLLIRAPREGPPELPALEELPTLQAAELQLISWHRQMRGSGGAQPEPLPDEPSLSAADLTRLNDVLARDPLTAFLLRKFATSSAVLAHVRRHPTGRQRIALSYDENLFEPKWANVGRRAVAARGWRPWPVMFQTPYVGTSAYHFELVMPAGLEVIASKLIDLSPDTGGPPAVETEEATEHELGAPSYDYIPERGTQIHLYRSVDEVSDALAAQVHLRAQREGFIGSARLAGFAVTGTLAACAALIRPLVRHGSGAPSLLLLFPGLLVALAARSGDHPLYVRLLRGVRRSLMTCGAFTFAGAALLALIKTGEHAHAQTWHRWFYIALTLGAGYQTAELWLARRLPTGADDHGALAALARRAQRRALRKAKRRARRKQRSLRIRITGPTITAGRAAELVAAASTRDDVLPLKVGPSRRWIFNLDPAVEVKPWVGNQPLLLPAAHPSHRTLLQDTALARRLAATIRWLAAEVDNGFNIEIRWAPTLRELRRGVRHVAAHGPKIVSGRQRPPWGPEVRAPESAAEVAAAARRGDLHLNRIYCVEGSPRTLAPQEPI